MHARFSAVQALAQSLPVEIGSFELSRDDIIGFAQKFDPQAFHLEEAAANASILGGFSASGWHSCAVQHQRIQSFLSANHCNGICDAYSEVSWLQPVRPDTRYTISLVAVEQAAHGDRLVFETCDNLGKPTMRVDSQWRFDSLAALAAQTVVPPLHVSGGLMFDDIEIGQPQFLGDYTFTKAKVADFAENFGAAAQQDNVNQWHITAAWMNRMITSRDIQCDEARKSGARIPEFGPAPGLKNLKWFGAVKPEETISYFTTPISKRKTSRPGWALVSYSNFGLNHRNEVILSFDASIFISIAAE